MGGGGGGGGSDRKKGGVGKVIGKKGGVESKLYVLVSKSLGWGGHSS